MLRKLSQPLPRSTDMNDRTFDPSTLIESYRDALAPAIRAQQEALKAFERVAR